jgi:hypothetical protein
LHIGDIRANSLDPTETFMTNDEEVKSRRSGPVFCGIDLFVSPIDTDAQNFDQNTPPIRHFTDRRFVQVSEMNAVGLSWEYTYSFHFIAPLQLILNLIRESNSASPAPLLFTGVAALLQHFSDEAGPARLVACAYTPAAVPVEIFVKQDELVPIRVALKFFDPSIYWPFALFVAQENLRKPAGELPSNFPQSKHLA